MRTLVIRVCSCVLQCLIPASTRLSVIQACRFLLAGFHSVWTAGCLALTHLKTLATAKVRSGSRCCVDAEAAQFCYLSLSLFPVFSSLSDLLWGTDQGIHWVQVEEIHSFFHHDARSKASWVKNCPYIHWTDGLFFQEWIRCQGRTWSNLYLLCTFWSDSEEEKHSQWNVGAKHITRNVQGFALKSHPPPVRLLRFRTDSRPWFCFGDEYRLDWSETFPNGSVIFWMTVYFCSSDLL